MGRQLHTPPGLHKNNVTLQFDRFDPLGTLAPRCVDGMGLMPGAMAKCGTWRAPERPGCKWLLALARPRGPEHREFVVRICVAPSEEHSAQVTMG